MSYILNKTESISIKKFQNKHYKKCNSGTSVIFTETGIGKKIEVKCNKCFKIKDVSDYSAW